MRETLEALSNLGEPAERKELGAWGRIQGPLGLLFLYNKEGKAILTD